MPRTPRLFPALALLLALTGCAGAVASPRPVAAGEERPALGAPDADHPRRGPAAPRQGTWYPYDLYTHCGVGNLTFGGRHWELSRLRTDVDSGVDGPRADRKANETAGWITLESSDVVVFEAAGLPPMEFRPVEAIRFACK
ncbi:hypothetical protein [Streptomyces sp. NPDC097619]|uniref:hypothetical protein n=1 Tax=Streptomyces sp. NPDC097619 TaxID=3157228 RepID=UPI00331CCF6A